MNGLQRVLIVVALIAAVAVVFIARQRRVADVADNAALTEQALPRLLDLGSTTCTNCKKMIPILDDLEVEYADRIRVDFIDVKVDREAVQTYGIKLIPTQIFFAADGTELWRHEGFFSREDILSKWRELGVELPATVEGS